MNRYSGDSGTGLISSVASITVFLTFLLFAVQLLFGLYTRSVVTDVAYDGARQVAGLRSTPDGGPFAASARARAEARMRQQLGQAGERARYDWSNSDDDTIALRVQIDTPRFIVIGFAGPLAIDHIDRTVRVRIEREQ